MSVFAIRVKVGYEVEVQRILERYVERVKFNLIENVTSFLTFTQKFKDGRSEKDFKNVLPGYIFVKINKKCPRIPAEVFHFIKSIGTGKVIGILQDSVDEEEYQRLFTSQEMAVATEPEIEAKMSVDVEEEEKTSIKQMVEHVTQIANKTQNEFIKRCRAFIRGKKATFRFPYFLFEKTRNRFEHNSGALPYKALTTGSFIVPRILQTLQSEYQVE